MYADTVKVVSDLSNAKVDASDKFIQKLDETQQLIFNISVSSRIGRRMFDVVQFHKEFTNILIEAEKYMNWYRYSDFHSIVMKAIQGGINTCQGDWNKY